jgi:hypothetical protein
VRPRTLLLLTLGIGLVSTVGIAWVGALRDPSSSDQIWSGARARLESEGEGTIDVAKRVGWLRSIYEVKLYPFSTSTRPSDAPAPESGVPWVEQGAVLPWISGAAAWPSWKEKRFPFGIEPETRIVHTVGWPIRALWCRYDWTGTSAGKQLLSPDGISTGLRRRWGSDRYVLALPVRPLLIGFIADFALYSTAAWTLIGLRPFLRTRSRRQRGCCIACGYDLRHDLTAGCPECGWNRPAPVSHQT